MSDDNSANNKVKVRLGVVFSARELEFEISEGAEAFIAALNDAVARGDKVLAFSGEKGKRILVPTDKLSYVEFDIPTGAGPIGFGF